MRRNEKDYSNKTSDYQYFNLIQIQLAECLSQNFLDRLARKNGFIQRSGLQKAKKGICNSRSFASSVNELSVLKEAVANFAGRIAYKLRKDKTCASILTVFIHTNQFRLNDLQYSNSKSLRLPVATNNSTELIKVALIGLNFIYRRDFNYKKAGVIVTGIVPDDQVQTGIFDTVNRESTQKAMKVMDQLNVRYGYNTVKVASQGFLKVGV